MNLIAVLVFIDADMVKEFYSFFTRGNSRKSAPVDAPISCSFSKQIFKNASEKLIFDLSRNNF